MADGSGIGPEISRVPEYLAADLRDSMLGLFRDLREPWHQLDEKQQRRTAERVAEACDAVVIRAVETIAAREYPVVPAILKETKIKDGIEGKFTMSRSDPLRHQVFDAAGKPFIMVLADPAVFMAPRAAVIDRQQPDLPLASEAEPPQNGIGLDDSGPGNPQGFEAPQLETVADPGSNDGYTLGYEDGRQGRPMSDTELEEGSNERVCYEAGWCQAQLDGLADNPKTLQQQVASTRKYFDDMGSLAAEAGLRAEECPLAEWMPARKWWIEGFQEKSGEPKPPRRGRPRGKA